MAAVEECFDSLFFDSTSVPAARLENGFLLNADWLDDDDADDTSAEGDQGDSQPSKTATSTDPSLLMGIPQLPSLSQCQQNVTTSPKWEQASGKDRPQSSKSPQIGVVAPSQQPLTSVFAETSRKNSTPFVPLYGSARQTATILETPGARRQRPPPYEDPFHFSQAQDSLQTPLPLTFPGVTPGGSDRGPMHLRPVTEIPERYREVFTFPYFNNVQSKVFDDALYSDRPLVLCAPTGSGKTVIFELAIIRLLIQEAAQSKVVYMAPLKALCSEKYQDWKTRFGPLGLRCLELTGDTGPDDYYDLQDTHIIFTTPEKWDSMTRRWRDNQSLVQMVKLFLIDEVHMLNDESRGATMEAVISRMKTVQSTLAHGMPGNFISVRFVAVSATVPNVEDVAEWLSTDKEKPSFYNIDDSYRPVRLRKVVLGYPCSENCSEFRFDLSLNYKLAMVIHTYSDQKPTLVFCATRKSTMQAASILAKDARFVMDTQHRQRLQGQANLIKETKLRELVHSGIGFHHAGLDLQDRRIVEELFAQGDLPVLMATSTLAMGVNLPAHLVVIKSTQHYVTGIYQEYTESQILQMIGRAGRPQHKYDSLLNGTQLIESSLHRHLVEHLMAEVVLNTITAVTVALDWLKSTFLYIRVMKNPTHYGIPRGLSQDKVEKKLQEMCLKDLNSLASIDLLRMDEDCFDLKATDTGRLMVRYCVAFDTMKNFHKLSGTETIGELLTVLCKSQEFSDVQLRTNEKRILNTLNKDRNRATIRFPMPGKIKTNEMKVSCLIQTQLSSLPLQDFALQQDTNKIFRASNRIARCLMEMAWQKSDYKAVLNSVILVKCLRAKLWENSKHVSKQLHGIGVALANALVNAGVCTFQKIEETNPRDLEMIVNRHAPFGKLVQNAVKQLPKYQVCIDQSTAYTSDTAELTVTVHLSNRDALLNKSTTENKHTCLLLVGDADNKTIFKTRISDATLLRTVWSKKISVSRASRGDELSVNYISQDWVGLDVQSAFTPVYSRPRQVILSRDNQRRPPPNQHQYSFQHTDRNPEDLEQDGKEDAYLEPGRRAGSEEPERRACSHRCTNKDFCAHECCKIGIPVKRRRTMLGAVASCMKDLQQKLQHMPQTPRLQMSNKGLPSRPDFQQYSYTPRGQGVGPRTPAVTSTPSTPRGWEHMELYEHRPQNLDYHQTAEDQEVLDDENKLWFTGTDYADDQSAPATQELEPDDEFKMSNVTQEMGPSYYGNYSSDYRPQKVNVAKQAAQSYSDQASRYPWYTQRSCPASASGTDGDAAWFEDDSLPDLDDPVSETLPPAWKTSWTDSVAGMTRYDPSCNHRTDHHQDHHQDRHPQMAADHLLPPSNQQKTQERLTLKFPFEASKSTQQEKLKPKSTYSTGNIPGASMSTITTPQQAKPSTSFREPFFEHQLMSKRRSIKLGSAGSSQKRFQFTSRKPLPVSPSPERYQGSATKCHQESASQCLPDYPESTLVEKIHPDDFDDLEIETAPVKTVQSSFPRMRKTPMTWGLKARCYNLTSYGDTRTDDIDEMSDTALESLDLEAYNTL